MFSRTSFRTAGILFLALVVSTVSRAADTYYLRKLIIADSEAKAAAAPANEGGVRPVVVEGVEFLSGPEFAGVVAPFIGKPIDNQLLNGLVQAIIEFARSHDRLVPQVQIPNKQDVSAGTLRLAVLVGRYNQLLFHGNRFFSDKLLEQKLGIKPGEEVRRSSLEEAVNWANSNPFRAVKVLVNPTPEPGKADLVVDVKDIRPIRFGLGYNDDGIPILGRNQYSASVQYGNLWGRDHQASYQFLTTDDYRRFQAHVFSYSAPLPWRHYLEFSGSYVLAKPSLFGGLVDQTGESTSGNLRYRIPSGSGDKTSEYFFGADFKESNNNLQYGGTSISHGKFDIIQAVAGFTSVRRDKQGAWSLGANLNLSPGGLDSRNTDRAFQPEVRNGEIVHVGRLGARAQYATATLSLQRLQKLPKGWELFSRVVGQYATSNLVADEQLTIGGSGTVRGVDPNLLSGEYGYVFNNDLQTPVWKHTLGFLPKTANELNTRFTLFYDAAQVFYKHHFPVVNQSGRQVGWDDDFLHPLASVGVGVRMSVANNLSLSLDYGWQVTHPKLPTDQAGRGHIKVVLAF